MASRRGLRRRAASIEASCALGTTKTASGPAVRRSLLNLKHLGERGHRTTRTAFACAAEN
jgi:hypothetical protein